MKSITNLFLLLFLSSCGTLHTPYISEDYIGWGNDISTENEIIHSLYLVGDAGELDDITKGENFVLNAVKSQLSSLKQESTLVFLGDNIYPNGLVKKDDPAREISERKLIAQLNLAKEFPGNSFFIPGNHDWNKGHKGGRKSIKRQEDFLEDYFDDTGDKKIKMYPSDACGDPKVVKINKDLVFVFIDTQWWLQNWSEEKKINKGCDIKSKTDFLKTMEEIFVDHKNDQIVLLMHHPIKSNGLHGGKFSWKHHIFPLHELNNLYIPLPILGSLYPLFRQTTGSVQDISHQRNKELMQGINDLATELRINVFFAAGHEHCLQYFDEDKLKYIVSGSGSKQTYTRRGGKVDFASESRGFAKINFYENFEAWLEFYTINSFDEKAKLAFKTQLREARPGTEEEEIDYPPVSQKNINLAANKNFKAGPIKKAFLGKQYRSLWSTEVLTPIIDLESQNGGLTPIKKGGGMASNSLRMEQADGKQYILRSINKDYTKLVPPQFENLKLLDVMKDQNSASHPYGALIIPSLSKAAGIYYTEPRLVYLKHQKGLGNYNSQFPEEMYLLEQRPSGDWIDHKPFGNSSKIISYSDLLDELVSKKNHYVDQKWVLKSRIFDLFIHDWDRHDDQWRWASFEDGDKTIYRPIPRDRDQAFYKFVGVVPWYISTFMMKKFKTMKADVRDVKNLSFNARNFDRYFLNQLEWSEWKPIVAQLKNRLSDEIIRQSMDALPKELQGHKDNLEIIDKLISRRDKLEAIAKRLYDFLAKEVEISATDNDELFEVERFDDGSVKVKSFILRKKKGKLLKYERKFYAKETKEIRIFGLRGKDQCVISGSNVDKIKIRFIGGEDDDQLNNNTVGANLVAYDSPDGMTLEGVTQDKRSLDIESNEYDRTSFQYNTNLPSLFFGITPDDGFWFGGAYTWTSHAWRKHPYKSKQKLALRVAPTGDDAFNLSYDGDFPDAIGKLDFIPRLKLSSPEYENYFGLGNNTLDLRISDQYNWVRMQQYEVSPMFKASTESGRLFLNFGPTFHSNNVINTLGRVSEDPIIGLAPAAFERRNYLGLNTSIGIAYKDHAAFPGYGFGLSANATHLQAFSKDEHLTIVEGQMSFLLTLVNKPQIVLANEFGYQKVYGDAQFYHYPDLGNNSNLRGYRNERFRGTSAFYHNLDLRLHLFKWNNTLVPMDVGILGGYDYGRVWLETEDSDQWHDSRTVGIWMNLLGVAILQPYYSFTDDGNIFSLQMGFSF